VPGSSDWKMGLQQWGMLKSQITWQVLVRHRLEDLRINYFHIPGGKLRFSMLQVRVSSMTYTNPFQSSMTWSKWWTPSPFQ
jgi:hypothetical protein